MDYIPFAGARGMSVQIDNIPITTCIIAFRRQYEEETVDYTSEIRSIENFIRQEHYRDAGNVMGRMLEHVLLEAYQQVKVSSDSSQQRDLLDVEDKIAPNKRVDTYTLGQLAGLYREAHVLKLMSELSGFSIRRSLRIPIGDLVEIRNRCVHPQPGETISLEELEYFLSSLKVILREMGSVDADVLGGQVGAVTDRTACPRCSRPVDSEFPYCPYCGSRMPETPASNESEIVAGDLSGEYVSTFEDVVDGEPVTVTAKVKLYGEGDHYTGETWLPGNPRAWRIEGTVSSGGYFYGIYYAKDPLDHGVGNFFLKASPNRSLDGLWAGYDSMNGGISSGAYSFVPCVARLALESIERRHVPRVLKVADEQLGHGFIDGDDVFAEPDSSGQSNKIAIAAIDESVPRVIGFGLAHVVKPEAVVDYVSWPPDETPTSVSYADAVGIIKTVAVASEYRGRGVGHTIVQRLVDECMHNGAEVLCSIAWKAGESINIGGVLTTHGFSVDCEIPDYWKDDSLEKGYHCPRCGAPPCGCTGVIFIRERY
jgi:GNAT superfamily N-acetyltransferase